MRSYRVLKKTSGDNPAVAPEYGAVGIFDAHDAAAAIAAAVAAEIKVSPSGDVDGTYVAISDRSWTEKPVSVEVETKVKVG